jgi:hypothetical protein
MSTIGIFSLIGNESYSSIINLPFFMKTCIWCRQTQLEKSFDKKAHTIPQNLGGRHICENVCDECNLYFGSHQNGNPSIETILKETFNITRARLLDKDDIGKNKTLTKFSSIYFNVSFKKHSIEIKPAYKVHRGFQDKICRQMKKGIYKIFLEESERQYNNALDPRYDFIREFARYDLSDYPLYYFERNWGIIAAAKEWIKHPELLLDENAQMKYLIQDESMQEFEFLGHVMSIAKSRYWLIDFDNYIKKSAEAKRQFFKGWKMVKNFNDVDLSLSILDNKS